MTLQKRRVLSVLALMLLLAAACVFRGSSRQPERALVPAAYDASEMIIAGSEGRPPQRLDLRSGKSAAAKSTFGHLPMTFEENRGQVDEQVRFFTRGNGYTLFLTPSESVLSLRRAVATPSLKPAERFGPREIHEPAPIETSVVRMKLSGSNANARVSGVEELEQRSNYFIGNDPAKWHTNVPHFNRVKSEGVYPGVDLVYYSTDRQLEYDFVVAPGADAKQICMKYDGAEQLEIDADGSLLVKTNGAEVRQHPPIIYQPRDGARVPVTGRYVLRSPNEVAFELGAYDASRTLVIDPVLVYSTYLGGTQWDEIRAIAVDSSENVYVSGRSGSVDFPATPGAYNSNYRYGGFVTKLNSSGTAIIYSTFFGSRYTLGHECYGLAIDGSGNAYVTGLLYAYASTQDFPTTAGAFQTTFHDYEGYEAFLSKFSADGSSLMYSTFIGGNNSDIANGIALDSGGNAYVTGYSRSSDFPTTAGALDRTFSGGTGGYCTFVCKINPGGAGANDLVYSTFFQGISSGSSIKVDNSGNAFVTGWTNSTTFPTVNAFQTTISDSANGDGFVVKLNSTGSALLYSTYLGGTSAEYPTGIAIDSSGNACVTGQTNSTDFPIVNALQSTAASNSMIFISKIAASGSSLIYSTYLGGSAGNTPESIALDGSGNAIVVGFTYSSDFPIVSGIKQQNSGADSFVSKINSTGSALIFSSYLGGGDEVAYAVAVDSSGGIYVAGDSRSAQFPVINALQPTYGGNPSDGFIAKIDLNAPAAYPQTFSIRPNQTQNIVLTGSDVQNDPLTFTITVLPAHGSISGTLPAIVYHPDTNYVGSDSFTFKANDGGLDSNPTVVSISVVNSAPIVNAQSLTTHFGISNSIVLSGSDADNDSFNISITAQPLHGTIAGTRPNVTYSADVGYVGSDSFTFKANDGVADSVPATVSINVTNIAPSIVISASPTSIVPNAPVTFNATGNDADGDALTYAWDFGDGGTSTEQNPAHGYAEVGTYSATVTVSDPAGATAMASVTIQVSQAPIVRIQTSDVVGFGGLPFTFDASTSTDPENAIASYDWDFGDGTPHGAGQVISKVYDQPGTYTVTLTITDSAGESSSLVRVIEVLPGSDVGLFNGFMKFKVAWNRNTVNKDTLSFEASVNVGDDVVGNGTAVALEIVGQRFTGTLDRKQHDYSDPDQKWQVKAGIRHQPSGSVSLKLTIKKASLGLSFNQAGATVGADSHDIVSVNIPVHLEIGGHSFELEVPTDFKFSGDGTRAKGDGESE